MQKKEILTRKFSRAFTGYDIAEVDFFLDELYREFSLMEHELEALRARLASMEDAAQAAAQTPPPAAEGRGRAEIPAPPASERPAAPLKAALPAETEAVDAAALFAAAGMEGAPPSAAVTPAEADMAVQTGFYFEQMYTQAACFQTEGSCPEEAYAEEEAAFLMETEEAPGYVFTQEDAAQGPQEAE